MIENSLIRQIIDGATHRYAELVQLHQSEVFALIVRIVGNEAEAEELTQDVFLKAYTNLRQFKAKSSFSTWLYRIAYNEAMSHTRRRKEVTIPFDERRIAQVGEQELEDWELSEQEEEVERLIGAIEALPSQERALITMFYYNGFTTEKCAEITEQSVANIKTKLHRIRKKLYLMVKS